MSAYRSLIQRIGHARPFAVWLRAAGARLDCALYRASDGRVAITGPALFPVLLLTTTGRRSGRPRTTPLIYHRDGVRLVVACEDTGLRRPAAWPLNLLANPCAAVRIGGRTASYSARPADKAEIERHWPALLSLWPAHATYHARSGRRRVFVLEPLS
jgi:deazaflavin-dependent oxidoreductase (nitroreductase family)